MILYVLIFSIHEYTSKFKPFKQPDQLKIEETHSHFEFFKVRYNVKMQ
jgi:hypothetical protein